MAMSKSSLVYPGTGGKATRTNFTLKKSDLSEGDMVGALVVAGAR